LNAELAVQLHSLCLKNQTRDQVEADLQQLLKAPDVDEAEAERRKSCYNFSRVARRVSQLSSRRTA